MLSGAAVSILPNQGGNYLCRQLMEQQFAAVSGMTGGKGLLDKKAVSVRGKVRNIGKEKPEEATEGTVLNNQAHCLHCGRCYEICAKKAILKRG